MSDNVCQLVSRCLLGDQSAMVELVEQHQGQVFGLCYRMLRHRQDAEDVTQECFVRALRRLHTWDSSRAFLPWLLAIAGNRCRTLLSVRMRRPPTTSMVEQLSDDALEEGKARNLAEEVELALGTLRAEYRQAFLLFHQHEMSYAQIGTALDCPLGTVKTWVHRARRELLAQLRERGVVEELRHAVRRV
ncbi:MAG TPA: sigma-70 family RNA polymerase sigma factor [Pirellulales bacterium]|nr:sigma-70 family RNA polymerase sigma factor [Pirellulales bacterium]